MPFETVIRFGQFAGARVIDLPPQYCAWLLDSWEGREKMSATMKRVLAERVKIHAEETAR